MRSSRHSIIPIGLALLLAAVALLAVGCAGRSTVAKAERPSSELTQSVTPSAAIVATPASSSRAPDGNESAATPANDASAERGEGGSGGAALSSSQADALDAELSAIQSELDRLSLPGESDFDSIGQGLK